MSSQLKSATKIMMTAGAQPADIFNRQSMIIKKHIRGDSGGDIVAKQPEFKTIELT